MRSHLTALATIGSLLCASSTLSAQQQPTAEPRDRLIEISVSYNLMLPIKTDDTAAQRETLEAGRRMLYEIAAGECKVLQATIASSCRLERLNVQSSIQRHAPSPAVGQNMAQLGANGSYRIVLKSIP
jgi:hypothetical protein